MRQRQDATNTMATFYLKLHGHVQSLYKLRCGTGTIGGLKEDFSRFWKGI